VTFCAICVDEIFSDPPRREPLGKNNALVNVCDGCALDAPREVGPRAEYEAGDGAAHTTIRRHGNVALREMGAPRGQSTDMEAPLMRSRTAGWLLVRVPRHDAHGRARDVHDAFETLRDRPYAKELRLIGMAPHWVCFERPDPNARGLRESINPLVWLEPYRTEPTA
jgi:hypothetical protein